MRLLLLLTLVAVGCSSPDLSLTTQDIEAVRALEEAYRTGWLANDSSAVMATLEPDAVLMPAGIQPLVGAAAIRTYWWPDDGSETTIESYDIVIEEIDGSGSFAYLRGRGSLAFTYRDATGAVSQLTSQAVHLSVARRGSDGEWRISRRAWSAIR